MIVTALHPTSPERVNLLLEDGQEIPTTLGIVTELRLFAGKDLEEAQLELIRSKTEASQARDRALDLLSRRPHSRKELSDKLRMKGYDNASSCSAVDWLEEHGYLDDRNYAGMVVRHYTSKGYGIGRIRAELSKRGIPRELREEALSEMPNTDDSIDRFIRNRLKDPNDRDEIRKLSASLARRGFGWEEIQSAIERYHDSY